MISTTVINNITKMVYPGMTIHFTELNDINDKSTISDSRGELRKALASNNLKDIGIIIQAVYKNSKYDGELVNDHGKIRLVSNGKVYNVNVTNNGSILKIKDSLNNKITIIEYKKSSGVKEVKLSLQDQILTQLKKRRMSDKEVIDLIKNLEAGIK